MTKFRVIKDINFEAWQFKPSCKKGDILYQQDKYLFNEKDIFICEVGSQLQVKYTEEIKA